MKSVKCFIILILVGCSQLGTDPSMLEREGVIIERIPGIGSYNGCSSQGLAIFDRYAFLTYDTGYIQVLDLNNMRIVSSYAMPERAHSAMNHAGLASFSSEFYYPTDEFPLLYVSSYKENKCFVLRVDLSKSSLIQEIEMENSWHYLVDTSNNSLIVRLNNNHYYVFDLPSLEKGTVTLDRANAISSFLFDIPEMSFAGAVCREGKMYVLCYYKNWLDLGVYDRLVIYNYLTKEIERVVVFTDYRIRNNEFEGISFDKHGNIVISFTADQLAIMTYE